MTDRCDRGVVQCVLSDSWGLPAAAIGLRGAGAGHDEKERGFFEQSLSGHIYGTPAKVDVALGGLVQRRGRSTDHHNTYDRADLLVSYRLLAELAGLRSLASH